ncbi:MAG TPA: AAA family ATPase, partial [Planctomycetota bacterium]|nr:AAA family ATPase [Planctomycetota bacterium]
IRAENFLKFESLRLDDLPDAGIVGIEGPNESGKSTIAESILFAFFGCAREGKSAPIEQLIRWGSLRARVEVEFSVLGPRGAEEFVIVREIDRLGTNWARVLDVESKVEVARGNVEVREFVRERLRMDASEFQRAVLHCQSDGEIRPETYQEFIDKVTGVRVLSSSRDSLRRDIECLEREYAQYQKEIERAQAQAQRFAGAVTRLPEIERQVAETERTIEERQEHVASAREKLEESRGQLRALESCEKRILDATRAEPALVGRKLEHALAAYRDFEADGDGAKTFISERHAGFAETVEGLEASLRFYAEVDEIGQAFVDEVDVLRSAFDPKVDGSAMAELAAVESRHGLLPRRERRAKIVGRTLAIAFVVAAALVGALFAIDLERPEPLWVARAVFAAIAVLALAGAFVAASRRRRLRSEIEELQTRQGTLRNELAERQQRIDALSELDDLRRNGRVLEWLERARPVASDALAERLARFSREQERFLRRSKHKESGPGRVLQSILRREKQARESIAQAIQDENRQLRDVEGEIRRLRAELDRLQNDLRDARSQIARVEALDATCRELEERARAVEAKVADHVAAIRLLDETVASIRLKTGPALEQLLRGALPRLTAGRYRDVRWSEPLDLRVFSSERGDFVAAKELSGGTNEALLLALRLAFAQALVTARGVGPHAVILDEPFRAMDGERVGFALEALRDLSKDLIQFVVIQPAFTAEHRRSLDRRVSTTPDTRRLELSLAEKTAVRERDNA